jgi:hypothetical protein
MAIPARDDFDPERLVAQSGDEDFGRELLRLLAEDGARYVDEIRASLALDILPVEALRRQLHGVKNVFGAVGAEAAVEAAEAVSTAVKKADEAHARRLAVPLIELTEGVLSATRAYLERRDA